MSAPLSSSDYSSGHPWYYVLGGKPLRLKEIIEKARADGYRGYNREEIAVAASRCEPRRSQDLRALRTVAINRLRFDIAGYRRAVRDLHNHRNKCDEIKHYEVHTSVSLKHNHLYNEFAHLIWIDDLLSAQRDLFEC